MCNRGSNVCCLSSGGLWPPRESSYFRGVRGLAPVSSEASRLSRLPRGGGVGAAHAHGGGGEGLSSNERGAREGAGVVGTNEGHGGGGVGAREGRVWRQRGAQGGFVARVGGG